MSDRVHVRVVRRRPLWGITVDDTDVATRRTQLAAWLLARSICRALEVIGLTSQAVLHARSGRIITEHTYPRSSDPSPPEG